MAHEYLLKDGTALQVMTTSQNAFLAAAHANDIFALANHVDGFVETTWEAVLREKHDKLIDAYARAGDMAYGTYLDSLFRPVEKQFRQAGLKLDPGLPGDFNISREWGNADETDQQRWFWCTVTAKEGAPVGTLVTIVYHDHSQFRLPRRPRTFGLSEWGKDAVVAALSERSEDFGQAREASVEIAEYLQSLST
jgi:hypothetical protein